MKKILYITFISINLFAFQNNFIDINKHKFKIKKDITRINNINKFYLNLTKIHNNISKLKAVNNYLNRFQYKSDILNYNKRDYWANPLEFVTRGGDCEDFVIAKYFMLKKLDFKDKNLFFIYSKVKGIPHARLGVIIKNNYYILDSMKKNILIMDKKEKINSFQLTLFKNKVKDFDLFL